MDILITGSRGFLGGHLAVKLEGLGHNIVGRDDTDFQHGKNVIADLRSPHRAEAIIEGYQPDLVVHMAAQVGRLFGEDDIVNSITSNAVMTSMIAHVCGKHGIPLVYTSTSEVYGDNGEVECYEDEGPWSLPHNIYGLTKLWGEQVCKLYAPEGLKIIRPSMPYGPGVPPGRGRAAITNVVWQALTNQDIPIHRGSERSWCYVTDTIEAIRLVIEKGEPGAYNIGRDDRALSMERLAHIVCETVGANHNLIKIVDPPAAQTVVKRLNMDKLYELGWVPQVEYKEGIAAMVEWCSKWDRSGNRKHA